MYKKQIILALETSYKLCSIALWQSQNQDNKIIDYINHVGTKTHNQHLFPSIHNILSKANLKLQDLTGFAYGIGPGSYTGLRIGCAAIQGLAYSLNIPIYTCSSLRLIAQDYAAKNPNINKKILVISDAHAGDYYIGQYMIKNNLAENIKDSDNLTQLDLLLTKQEVLDLMKKYNINTHSNNNSNNNIDGVSYQSNAAYIGDAVNQFQISKQNTQSYAETLYFPTARAICDLLPQILLNDPIKPSNLEPVYLRTQNSWAKNKN